MSNLSARRIQMIKNWKTLPLTNIRKIDMILYLLLSHRAKIIQ